MRRFSLLVAGLAVLGFSPIRAANLPLEGGTISIEPRTADGEYDSATRVFVDATTAALSQRGFTILDDPGHAAYVGELVLSRVDVGTATAKGPGRRATAGPGAALGAGVGVAIPFSTGKSDLVPLQRTTLELRIHKRGDAQVLWRGAAVTVRTAGVQRGTVPAVAADLSQAIFQAYPNQAPTTIGVP